MASSGVGGVAATTLLSLLIIVEKEGEMAEEGEGAERRWDTRILELP
jgi:hypothetical protein